MKILIIILCGLFLSGCGQYGSLYLPDGETPVTNAAHKSNDALPLSQEETTS